LDGVAEARTRAGQLGVTLVAGCELSCDFGASSASMHVLVYFLEPGEGPLQDELFELQEGRDDRNRALAARLNELGLPITYEEMQEEAGGSGAGRPHAAAVLVRKGVVGSVTEAFEHWLGHGRPGYVERRRLEPAQAVRLARESGSVTSVAHPLSLELSEPELEGAMRGLAELGLTGMECIYGRYSPEEREQLAGLARRLGLVVTGGSDHHGNYKPDLRVGIGRGDLRVPDRALEELADRLPS
ncbi:MAG: hypothetical protein M3404_01985, partial [Actinomycetota bacterium]|nr:hypothetical protein [Actinomycetota bacterium]